MDTPKADSSSPELYDFEQDPEAMADLGGNALKVTKPPQGRCTVGQLLRDAAHPDYVGSRLRPVH